MYSSVIIIVKIISPPQYKSVCKVRNSCNGSEFFSYGPRGDGSSPCAAASRYIHVCAEHLYVQTWLHLSHFLIEDLEIVKL